jgi:hypothetical protein
MGRQHILEPAAQEIADATSRLPFDELGPDGAQIELVKRLAPEKISSGAERTGE